jgi:glycosyltransferase involved in cell wall biosynthesis
MAQTSESTPRIAVIIPTYNRAHSIGAAIDSVLSQPEDVALIVVDDGSVDGTAGILRHYADEPRVTIHVHDRNRGVTAAKNTGLNALPSRIQWFGILDSDDTLTPGALSSLLTAADAHDGQLSQVIGWCSDARTGDPTGAMTHREGTVTYDDALCGRFTGEFWHIARRELLDAHRFHDLAGGGEASLWWILLRERPAWLIPEVVRRYDRSGQDRVGIPSYEQADAARRMWSYRAVLDAVGSDMRLRCPRRYGELMGEMAKWAALCGDHGAARRGARSALRYWPTPRAVALNLLALSPSWILRRAARRRAHSAAHARPASSR